MAFREVIPLSEVCFLLLKSGPGPTSRVMKFRGGDEGPGGVWLGAAPLEDGRFWTDRIHLISSHLSQHPWAHLVPQSRARVVSGLRGAIASLWGIWSVTLRGRDSPSRPTPPPRPSRQPALALCAPATGSCCRLQMSGFLCASRLRGCVGSLELDLLPQQGSHPATTSYPCLWHQPPALPSLPSGAGLVQHPLPPAARGLNPPA